MPRCDGLPEGPCPSIRNDNTVRVGEGDLMLCKSCDKERFECFLNSKRTAGAGNSGDNTQTTRRIGLRSNAKPEANKNSSVSSSSSSVYGPVKESKGSDIQTSSSSLPCSVCSEGCTSYLSCDICCGIYDQNCSLLPKQIFDTLLPIVQYTGWVCVDCRNNCRSQLNSCNVLRLKQLKILQVYVMR